MRTELKEVTLNWEGFKCTLIQTGRIRKRENTERWPRYEAKGTCPHQVRAQDGTMLPWGPQFYSQDCTQANLLPITGNVTRAPNWQHLRLLSTGDSELPAAGSGEGAGAQWCEQRCTRASHRNSGAREEVTGAQRWHMCSSVHSSHRLTIRPLFRKT